MRGRYCVDVEAGKPRHAADEEVTCWEPSSGYEPGYPYKCGNSHCYKVTE